MWKLTIADPTMRATRAARGETASWWNIDRLIAETAPSARKRNHATWCPHLVECVEQKVGIVAWVINTWRALEITLADCDTSYQAR